MNIVLGELQLPLGMTKDGTGTHEPQRPPSGPLPPANILHYSEEITVLSEEHP